MLKIVGIGDNVVDRYLHIGTMFPGGNAVNVPVLAHRLGARAAYVGIIGTDAAGRLVKQSLLAEGVDISRLQQAEGANGMADVDLVDGDRVFVGGNSKTSVARQISLTPQDFEYAKDFDLIHTSIYSFIEQFLPQLHATGVPVSFDYSDEYTDDYIKSTIKYVDFALFSGGDKPLEDIKRLQQDAVSAGVKLALVTRGSKGAIAFDGNDFYEQDAMQAEIVDTMGAGDAFVACFLVSILSGENIKASMGKAAAFAAENCRHMGTFGYGAPL
ncbi:MAG: PfkB family carbohydrate kinase [Clostridiales bacterium]|jgi:fructoselysine 6-kinase|nr:PfkB family carbohydrate kinase [Clostridiales bacterium]